MGQPFRAAGARTKPRSPHPVKRKHAVGCPGCVAAALNETSRQYLRSIGYPDPKHRFEPLPGSAAPGGISNAPRKLFVPLTRNGVIGCVGILAVLGLFVMVAVSRSGPTATPTTSAVVTPAPVTVTVTATPAAPVNQPTAEADPAATPAPGGGTNYVPVPVPHGDGYCHTCHLIPHPSFGHHGHFHL